MNNWKSIWLFLCLAILAISGCQSNSTHESKVVVEGNSLNNSVEKQPISKKPKWPPFDWSERDIDSREVWFTKNDYDFHSCEDLTAKSEIKKTFLRNGNAIISFETAHEKSRFVRKKIVDEILNVKAVPSEALLYIEGISGYNNIPLKPLREIKFEITPNIETIEIEYILEGPVLRKCVYKGWFFENIFEDDVKTQSELELARGMAIERIGTIAKLPNSLLEKPVEVNPPEIKIDEYERRVSELNNTIRGSVHDDSGVATILIRGKKVAVSSDGRFIHRTKLGYGENDILVQAEDINGNVSEKTITIIREEFIADDVLADVDLPPQTKMSNPDALAVVIGVENYQYVPDATYAYNDAEVFREYLAETLGMKRQRIKLATNTKATQAEFTKLLGPNGWLARNIVKGKSDVVVYFSGHGIASPDAMSSGILPFDVDPNYSVGLPTDQLYKDLSAMGARSVTVFLDACFTGQTRSSEMLIANARPIVVRPKASSVPSNVTVISAASGSQISGAIEEKEHGLFTYYVLKGLGGEADGNKDAVLKTEELSAYVSSKVQEQAALSGREQTPELQGDASRVLVRFQ